MSALEDVLEWQLRALGFRMFYEREYGFARLHGIRHEQTGRLRMWRFDFAWPAQRVAVEVEGGIYAAGGHNRGRQIESDCEKVSTAAALGWRVLRVTREMIEDGRASRLIEQAVRWKEG